MLYHEGHNNRALFFNELSALFDNVLNSVDKETSDALNHLFTDYKYGETIPSLISKLKSSSKAQKYFHRLICELTAPDGMICSEESSESISPKVATSKYKAELIKDITFEQKNTKVERNEKHVKVWRFRNSGDEAWPRGCRFVPLSGTADGKWITFQLPPVPVNPGQIADAGFQFVSPGEVGMYELRYALESSDGSGIMTSEPLALSFTVVEKIEKEVKINISNDNICKSDEKQLKIPTKNELKTQQQRSSPPPPPPTSQSQSQPSTISINLDDDDDDDNDVNMGFKIIPENSYDSKINECIQALRMMGISSVDRSRIEPLVKKHDGDVNAVVNEFFV